MKVSVAFITYNHEPFVAKALDSVLMQDGVEFEIVVGEDCSTDQTREVVAGYAGRHPGRIRILPTLNNLGMQRNVARTLGACGGEYVALLEGDDYWTEPDKLLKQVKLLDHRPGCAICFHNVFVVYEDGRPSHPFRLEDSKTVFTAEDLAAVNFIPTCSAMLRNRPCIPCPDWLLHMPMVDWPLFLLCAERGTIAYLSDRMGAYRVHSGGVWSSLDRIDVLEKSLLASRTIRANLGGKYGKVMDRSVSRWHYDIARILSDGKTPARAVLHVVESFAACPFHPDLPKGALWEILRKVLLRGPWSAR
jgi:glycosyltransferase involved in cell wall biosynthesis